MKLLFARTISEEGRVLAVGKKNIRDVSKYLNYPLYSNARVLIISMPELKVGAVVEYAAEISSSKLVADTHFSYRYTLQEKYPIHEALYSVDVPSDRPFRYTIVNQRYTPRNVQMRPQMDTHDTYTRYSWRFSTSLN